MKQIFSIIIVLVLYSNKLVLAQDSVKSPIVGNDRDNHDCIGSAGYIWSVLKKECVRTFELTHTDRNAIELISVDNTQTMVVLFSSDKTKAEVFYSGGNMIVNKSKKGKIYILRNDKNIVEKLINLNEKWQFVEVKNGKKNVLYQ